MDSGVRVPPAPIDSSRSTPPTASRAERERELATYHRECAARARAQADVALANGKNLFWQQEEAHEEIAMLHDRLADVYDREDRIRTPASSSSAMVR